MYLAPLTPHYPKYAKASDVIPSFLLLLHQSHLCGPSFLLPLYMSDRDQGGGSLEGTPRGAADTCMQPTWVLAYFPFEKKINHPLKKCVNVFSRRLFAAGNFFRCKKLNGEGGEVGGEDVGLNESLFPVLLLNQTEN